MFSSTVVKMNFLLLWLILLSVKWYC